MLALGRALMSQPSLLMLDEPSLGLAPLIVKEILNIVSELRSAGVSILLIEQNARAALQIADYGYVLENGEVALEGPSHDLACNPQVIKSYLGGVCRSCQVAVPCAILQSAGMRQPLSSSHARRLGSKEGDFEHGERPS